MKLEQKAPFYLVSLCLLLLLTIRGAAADPDSKVRILLLHHSTGEVIWKGGVLPWFENYNADNHRNYEIVEQTFPKEKPYGWKNYPYDYWNIWVNHSGANPCMGEPTLEMLVAKYDVISFKHCYPVSRVKGDTGVPDIASEEKRIENYRLQYLALKQKMLKFPATRFVVWTGAALARAATNEEQARRAREFFRWVREEWDQPGDNIFLWDLYALQTEDELYLKDEYAKVPKNSHPSREFAAMAAPLFSRRIVNVIEGRGDVTSLTGR